MRLKNPQHCHNRRKKQLELNADILCVFYDQASVGLSFFFGFLGAQTAKQSQWRPSLGSIE
jgi:hypothetical protein